MTLVESILTKLGAMIDRAHLFDFKKPVAKGVRSLFTQDLRPIGDSAMLAGSLVELWCILDDHPALTARSRVRFDVLEEDFLLTGGLDDQVISLLGTNAVPPESGFAIEQRETVFHELDPGIDVPTYLEEYRRTFSREPFPQFDTTILVLNEHRSENDQAVNTVPGAQSVAEDTPLRITGLSVTDVDGNLSTTQLAVTNGTLSVSLAGGATISAGANGTATLTLRGTQAQINAALATLIYQGTLNFNGSDTLTVTSTDASGGSDVDKVALTVTAVATRRSHVITWWRAKQVEDLNSESEMYFVVDIDGIIRAGSPILRTRPAVPGVAVRVIGNLVDAKPFVEETPEPLPDVPVSLGGRRALSGRDGDFVIDARLAAGEHRLEFKRPGIDTLALTVRVLLDAAGLATVNIVDQAGTSLFSQTTLAAATEDTVVTARLRSKLTVRVHKLRGTVLWPDSHPGGQEDVGPVAGPGGYQSMPANHLGTPLADRHVYVLPIPPGGSLSPYRPKTTRAWEALKAQPGVLQSSRPGAPLAKHGTAFDGQFEVKYVDFSAGSRYLLWVERFDPQGATDVTTEAPDHVVRTEQRTLIEIHEALLLTDHSNAGQLLERNRNLVDRQRNLSGNVVSWGIDAMRVVDRNVNGNNVRTLVRPDRSLRGDFDDDAIVTGGEAHVVPASRLVDNLVIQVLPLAPVDEPADEQGAAARRLRQELEQAAAAFPDGADLDDVHLVLDVGRLGHAVDLTGQHVKSPRWDAAALEARKVELLERTLVVRPGHDLDAARWHIDAVSLADAALVSIDGPNGIAATRHLDATVVPVLGAISPRLPAVAGRRLYLGPGHGLWPDVGSAASAEPSDWKSIRGGWQLNTGEDENDALQSAEINRIVRLAGMDVSYCRQIENLAAPGVANPQASVWVPADENRPQLGFPNRNFPRLWQQNNIYYLGVVGHEVVTNNQNYRAPVGNKNNHGINARVEHLVAEAARRPFDVVLFTHTNGAGGHGTLMMYLNIDLSDTDAEQGNPLGFGFADRLCVRVVERCKVWKNGANPLTGEGGGVKTMFQVNAQEIDRDLVATNDHFELQVLGDNPVRRRRVRAVSAAAPPGANWHHNVFAFSFPVVVSELLFHDRAEDAKLLCRAWFRRLAAEAMSLAIQDQVLDNAAAVTADQTRAVLKGIFGLTQPLAAWRPEADPPTAADLEHVVARVGGALLEEVNLTGTSLAYLVDAALARAHSYTRRHLVNALVAALRPIAGYADNDDLAATTEAVLQTGVALERSDKPPTRAEAGTFACLAVGLAGASLDKAETQPIGPLNQPLIRQAVGRPSAYFPRAEGLELAIRLRALRPTDIFRVANVFFADASWRRMDRLGQPDLYEFDPGTPVLLVVETDGFPWKGTKWDVSFILTGGGKQKTLACAARQPRRLVSRTWFVDWPPTDEAAALTITVRVHYRNQDGVADWKVLGTKDIKLRVVDPFATRSAP